ncbi:TonB-dependent receptor [Bacteroides sp.]|uniref:SusC/RagA family TonB-linked outer membrane protein n=1 Tax=Bacteroides sp. TaxID=29523 RepID=UPI00261E5C9A|nr:TonB-dependent receptor [Bacteroides sp.]MDD3038019.1 TonB-dependent receptor [Bacteroides sp.]
MKTKELLKRARSICLLLFIPCSLMAQDIKEITGTVYEEDKITPVIGANVQIKGTTVGTVTNTKGIFKLNAKPTDLLIVSYIGYGSQEVPINNNTQLKIVLKADEELLDEVVVTAWGRQTKSTMVGAVSTINPKELRGPTSNLTTMLAGRVAGIIGYQLSGEPGRDNAEFFVRGVTSFGTGRQTPLMLIDGVESTSNDLALIQPDDIESFSVLKDGTAASMYGSRGANGVLLVVTKRGQTGKTKFKARYESSISGNTRRVEMADNITYMKMANEAILTRDPMKARLYSQAKIDNTIKGIDPYLYPSNDWFDIMIRDNTFNHRANVSVDGGSERAKYYISGTYKRDNGMFKEHNLNGFSTNVSSQSYEVRSNIDFKITNTTDFAVRFSGLFTDYNGPAAEGTSVFKSLYMANPVAFNAVYSQDMIPWANHPLFGNRYMSDGRSMYYNPYASMLSGYKEDNTSKVRAQIELKQDFNFILPGLTGRFMAYTTRYSRYNLTRTKVPFYYQAVMDPETEEFESLSQLNPGVGEEWLSFQPKDRIIETDTWAEASINYDHTFATNHQVGAALFGYIGESTASYEEGGSQMNFEQALPRRKVSLSGRLTYGYLGRYLGEFNFGYNGSERFSKNHRYGFFPSFGLAWIVSEESFMQPLQNVISKLKVRGTYGFVGNDDISNWKQNRFFYMSSMNMNSGTYYFGENYDYSRNGIAITRYGNDDIMWEKSEKFNLAFELGLFNSMNVEIDLFHENRNQILMDRADLPQSMGLASSVKASVGKAKSKGMEIAMDYNKNITKDMWLTARGTFTYATSEMVYNEEPDYGPGLEHLSKRGNSVNQIYGYIAERLFIDDNDVANSPAQFDAGKLKAGDIKYRDINGDGVISTSDKVPIGYPTIPEINYGFGFSFGYKDFDISAYFQGEGRSSFVINAEQISPFLKPASGQERGLLKAVANNYWSEENPNIYAFYPRLSYDYLSNNYQTSTWWLRDGSFLKLKTVEIGYEPRGPWLKKKTGLSGFRIYVSGLNLLTFSKFKIWDPEMKSSGMGYPLQRVFNLGVQVTI